MSDSQFLTDAERVLRELENSLVERIGAARESNEAPAMNSAVGRLSFIDAYQQHQMDLHAQRQMSAQLASVRAALERVRNGTYGVCLRCGIEIPRERLEYLPDTPYCTPCNAREGS
ncbi:MAG TPA: TraR/DksA C4-type zinc finger protein [Planctomycetaceae bacterium]|nr:TraR/DksA C4-type zinc finger protein [Planctomycetaceae bacterium]